MVSTARGVVVSCLVYGLKLDWKFVSMVSPKWHHGMVSFSSWKQQTLTLKSCDHSFQPIRRLHSVKSHKSLEKLWDFMQKEFPFKEQSCETALLKIRHLPMDKLNPSPPTSGPWPTGTPAGNCPNSQYPQKHGGEPRCPHVPQGTSVLRTEK